MPLPWPEVFLSRLDPDTVIRVATARKVGASLGFPATAAPLPAVAQFRRKLHAHESQLGHLVKDRAESACVGCGSIQTPLSLARFQRVPWVRSLYAQG